jgi:hypothetical protein
MKTNCPQAAGLAVLATAAAVGIVACSGSASSTPQVASLPANSSAGGGSTAAGSTAPAGPAHRSGNATQLLDQWATCMRRHGDPGQTDPTIDSDKVIHIIIPVIHTGAAQATDQQASADAHGSTGPCAGFELAAQKALRGGQPAPKGPTMAQQLSYAKCMRAHGVTKFPDPNGSGETDVLNLDPNGPVFRSADKVCSQRSGMVAAGAPAPPGTVQVQSAGLPPGGVPPGGRTARPSAHG